VEFPTKEFMLTKSKEETKMDKKPILGILIIALLATVLFMNFASAPSPESKVEIKDKKDEHIFVVPGTQFCVERTLRNKELSTIRPVIVPLFSEGATLESIDVKRINEEHYMVDVPDWGTCQRKVDEPFPQYDETECGSLACSWNGTCYCPVDEDYSCITGYHQEERVREVVNYEPVFDGEYEAGEDSTEKEHQVELFREQLPSDLQELGHLGYSTKFDLEDEATIRMCFRAPPWGSEITSGRISYMTYYGDGYDYESSSWWNTSKKRRRVNDTEIVNLGVTDIPLLANASTVAGNYLWYRYNGSDRPNYAYYTDLAVDVEMAGSGASFQECDNSTCPYTDYQNTTVWDYGQPVLVMHFHGNSNDSSGAGRHGMDKNFDGDEYVGGKFGKAVNLTGTDYIDIDDFQWNTTTDWTVMAWVKTTDHDYDPILYEVGAPVIHDSAGTVRGGIGLQRGNISYGYYDGSNHKVTGSVNVSDGNWHFLAWVNNGSEKKIYLYVDGKLDASGTSGPTDDESKFVAREVGKGYDHYFDGIIDELRFWNNTLFTKEMINVTYHNSIGTAEYGDLEGEETYGGGGGGTGIIKTISDNLILSPASGITEVNGTLDTDGFSCTDCIGTDEVEDVYVLNSGDTMTGNLVLDDDSGDSPMVDLISGGNTELIIKSTDSEAIIQVLDAPPDLGRDLKLRAFGTGDVVTGSDFRPDSNKTYDLGSGSKWWKDAWIQTLHGGDVREYYIENPDYNYEVGDVVAIDLDSDYEIKPLTDISDRILGVVSNLSHYETYRECNETECHNITFWLDTDVAIYGKFSPAKVKGTIRVGDYLVASDELGVVTSMYNRAHPLNAVVFPASTDAEVYNLYAKMLPTLGIAMEAYDSTSVGTIKVVLGK